MSSIHAMSVDEMATALIGRQVRVSFPMSAFEELRFITDDSDGLMEHLLGEAGADDDTAHDEDEGIEYAFYLSSDTLTVEEVLAVTNAMLPAGWVAVVTPPRGDYPPATQVDFTR